MVDTRLESWKQIQPHIGPLQQKVLNFIKQNNGASDEDIRLGLNMLSGSQCARRTELWHKGLIKKSGRTKMSTAGRKVIIWEAV